MRKMKRQKNQNEITSGRFIFEFLRQSTLNIMLQSYIDKQNISTLYSTKYRVFYINNIQQIEFLRGTL